MHSMHSGEVDRLDAAAEVDTEPAGVIAADRAYASPCSLMRSMMCSSACPADLLQRHSISIKERGLAAAQKCRDVEMLPEAVE